ncbi:hypothetical protein E2C01_029084 [Portunus trituberculatus]|uniref:Uncharacterized protein n=1 Tax=Portunus trituberculatus TaxID=210409 RepID=A0A5B7EQY0_PORTR|nr:hypothetical protein [Portunus trituberculatus]
MMMKPANDVKGTKVLFKLCPLSCLTPLLPGSRLPQSWTPWRTSLLENPCLNPEEHLFLDRLGDSPVVAFSL